MRHIAFPPSLSHSFLFLTIQINALSNQNRLGIFVYHLRHTALTGVLPVHLASNLSSNALSIFLIIHVWNPGFTDFMYVLTFDYLSFVVFTVCWVSVACVSCMHFIPISFYFHLISMNRCTFFHLENTRTIQQLFSRR